VECFYNFTKIVFARGIAAAAGTNTAQRFSDCTPGLLERTGDLQDRALPEVLAEDLHADGQARFRLTARD
jgi:hypothetical protein